MFFISMIVINVTVTYFLLFQSVNNIDLITNVI